MCQRQPPNGRAQRHVDVTLIFWDESYSQFWDNETLQQWKPFNVGIAPTPGIILLKINFYAMFDGDYVTVFLIGFRRVRIFK